MKKHDELSPAELVERLSSLLPEDAAQLFQELIQEEQELSLRNLLKPYQDKVPLVLERMDVESIAQLFHGLNDYYIMKALFGNFRSVDEVKRQSILEKIELGKVAMLLNRMSIGVDNPKIAAKIMKTMPNTLVSDIIDKMEVASVSKLLEEMPLKNRATIIAHLNAERAVEVARAILGSENSVRTARLANILQEMESEPRRELLSNLNLKQSQQVELQIQHKTRSPLEDLDARESKLRCVEMTIEELASALDQLDPEKMIEFLVHIDPLRCAQTLSIMGGADPQKVADLLEEMNRKIIIGFKGSGIHRTCVEELYTCPAAGILENLDFKLEGNIETLRRLPKNVLESIMDRVDEEIRTKIVKVREGENLSGALPASLQLFTVGAGTRKTIDLGRGLKWTRIQERLNTGDRIKPVIIDLLEMNPEVVTIKACRAITKDKLMPVQDVAKLIGNAKREGNRPDKKMFSQLGLIQLSSVLKESGAIAAINGNHYFDYGHYMDALKLGVDPTQIPGLFFGDPVGWFVADGKEISPAAFNRAAFVVTREGKPYIERVFMTEVILNNGSSLKWDKTNIEKIDGKVILYNSLYGFRTKSSSTHIDIAIAKNQIVEVRAGEGGHIPLTGFVIAIPLAEKDRLLKGVKAGDPVRVVNNFPSSLGEVAQAMACGPYLVRNGETAISFEEEDFGEKDSAVMAFSLTRATETFEAARSFVMIRGGRLHIGTVSGTALGTGMSHESGGMTFGELAQLTMDLRADQAYALDGGGSSSIAVRSGNEVRILNTPTGGSDVAKGEERFINTYWLFFER